MTGVTGQQGSAGHGTSSARWARRALRQGKRGPFGAHPAVAIAAAVGVVAIAGTVAVTTLGGSSAPSITGTWGYGASNTFTFTSSGQNTYTVSELDKSAPQCAQAHDGTVTGSNRHYEGTINLYNQQGGGAGQCDPRDGTATITIILAANGNSASVNLVGSVSCPTCKPQTWTRQS